MQYIGIVECVSSGRLFIDDIISHGYKPLVINVKICTDYVKNYRRIISKELEGKVEFIEEDEDFDVLVSKIKKYDLVAVFPGAEAGVRLADKLSSALGLRGNDPATTHLRNTKKGMYDALGKAGIRRIESRVVTCDKDILDFWKEFSLERCIMKYSEGSGTVGLKMCTTPEDAVEHYGLMFNDPEKKDVQILIQEYIGGTEFIVNTLSCDGKHMVTDIWVYNKILEEDGTIVYDYAKLVKDLEPGHSDLVQYAYKVLDAVEMRWGLCHSEFKIDRKGPVLIETNPRPMGLGMTQPYYDEVLGHHQTDLAVDTYLNPKTFERLSRKMYSPLKYALMKIMIVPENIVGSFAPTFILSNMIGSTREILFFGKDGINKYDRTVDLHTSPIAIKMVNVNYGNLMKDYEILRIVEKRYFQLYYTIGEELEPCKLTTDIQKLLDSLDRNRRFLVATDEGVFAWQYGQRSETDGNEIYDGAVFAICGGGKAVDRYRQIFRVMRTIRSGGMFMAVPESYQSMTYGCVVMDFMMNIGGIRIMLPAYEANNMVYGIKK